MSTKEAIIGYDVRAARRAGLFYLVAAAFYIFGMMFVEGRVTIAGDTAATIRNIAASAELYRLGFLSTLLGHVFLLLVATALYELFSPVDPGWARLLVIFVVAGVSIAFLNRAHQMTVLRLTAASGNENLGDTSGLLAPLFLDLFRDGEKLACMFWGLWLFPSGVLAIKSGFAPKPLGWVLVAACILYLFRFFEFFLLDSAPAALVGALTLIHTLDSLAKMAAEFGFIAWLLFAGFRRPPSRIPGTFGIQ